MLAGWRYYWRRYLQWVPWQPCYICGRWYWAGLPKWWWIHHHYWMVPERFVGGVRIVHMEDEIEIDEWRWGKTWWPGWSDYCSERCCEEDAARLP